MWMIPPLPLTPEQKLFKKAPSLKKLMQEYKEPEEPECTYEEEQGQQLIKSLI